MRKDFDQDWRGLSEEVITGMKEWRLQHPRATLTEIETALDERLARLRARMLEDAALASAAADWKSATEATPPVCAKCGKALQGRGSHPRQVQTHGGQSLTLQREYGVCPVCKTGFFPLDEELQLLPGCLTPGLQEQLTRLGAWMPFEKAAVMFESFTRTAVSEDYVQEHTEKAGAAQVGLQTEVVEQLERETPPAPAGLAKLYLSADGAFVPLVGGTWEEVKTLVIGEVVAPVLEKGEPVVHIRNLSYFSRLTDVDTFKRLALVETHRRGVESAQQVGAVQDGSEWLQGFVDFHRSNAVRILDFPHAGGYVGKIGQATFGAESPAGAVWLKAQLHELKHRGPDTVLAELHDMVLKHPQAETLELPKTLAYLEKRQPQLQYPIFQAQGWPIGSGATESGNKLVVEARLKGAGMHWARDQVDPMLALRNIVCNDRWNETWPQIVVYLRRQEATQRAARQQKRREFRASVTAKMTAEVELVLPDAPRARVAPPQLIQEPTPTALPPIAKLEGSPRPAANHPWRHMPVGKAQYLPAKPREAAKL